MSIAERIIKAKNNLDDSRKVIAYKHGSINEVAVFDNLASEIESIPSGDANYLLVNDTDTVYKKQILAGASPLAKIKSIGGMTYKCNNLLDEGVISPIAVNESGTTRYGWKFDNLPSGTYYLSAFGNYAITDFNISYKTIEGGVYSDFTSIKANINYVTITISNNQSLIVYLYIGHTKLPEGVHLQLSTNLPSAYEPFFEGLRDSKVTSLVSHGKNLIDKSKIEYGKELVNDFTNNMPGWYVTDWIPVTQSTTYTLSGTYSNYRVEADVNHNTTYFGNGTTFTTKDNTRYVRFNSKIEGYDKPQLEVGIVATEYAPYKGVIDTVTIPSAVQALEGYGKGITGYPNTVDFVSRKFVKKCTTVIFDGTEDWLLYQETGVNQFYTYGLPLTNLYVVGAVQTKNNKFKDIALSDRKNNYETCYLGSGSAFCVNTQTCTTVDEWKAYLAEQYANGDPLTVIYSIAEPIETDISHLLPKDNYIEVESGGTIEFVNEYKHAVPSDIAYIRRVV